jgi:hypothetical protein
MNSLITIFIGHLIGDFVLKPKAWVLEIEKRKLRSQYLYIHATIHGLLVWMFLGFQHVQVALSIAIIHLGIDVIKVLSQTQETRTYWFFVDQLMHIISIIVISQFWFTDLNIKELIQPILNIKMSLWLGLICLSTPCAYLMKTVLQGWSKSLNIDSQENLPNAGLVIGILERILIYIFIINGSMEAVGFLLTAKSVFRFGDLTNAQDRMRTEYILVGTLLSFTIAIIISIIIKSTL